MHHKASMLAAVAGTTTPRIPWVPRLDLWYNAHRHAGTLPQRYRDAALTQILDDLGWGYHAIVPAFRDLRDPDDDVHRALGIYNLWAMPFRTEMDEVDFAVTRSGDVTTVRYRTPHGELQTRVLFDDTMRRAGISISHIIEYAVKSAADYAAVAHLFEKARIVPNPSGYAEFHDRVGERGIAAAFASLAGSPMHLLQRELMPPLLFFYELCDHPAELGACADSIGTYFDRVMATVAASAAPVVLFGANYDATMTYPPFFRMHIMPWLRRFADILHARGKSLLTHTDGENTGLLELYLESRIDIADSICPAPMTKLTFKQVRDVFADRVTIMGGIPSVTLLPEVLSDRAFEEFLDRFFAELGSGERLILGVSDTTPPAADFERLCRIAARIGEFGPVPKCGHGSVRGPI